MSTRILLADDHSIVRKGVRSLLERQPGMEIVGEASDGREAVRLAEEANPDFAIMDIAMPLLNGVDSGGDARDTLLQPGNLENHVGGLYTLPPTTEPAGLV